MSRFRRAVGASLVMAAVAVAAGCGKKGPPLAPLRPVPAQIADLAARRAGDTVHVAFTLPDKNADGTTPVDLARVEVYAMTVDKPADAPEGPAFLEKASGVGRVETVTPGQQAVVVEKLDAQRDLTPSPLTGVRPREPAGGEDVPPPVRIYVAVPVNRKGRRGAPSARATVSLAPAPGTPGGVVARYDEKAIAIEWLPVPGETIAGYLVYEGKGEAGRPLNETPLATTAFADARPMQFGVEHCYVVRAAAKREAGAIESEASTPVCVTPKDTFPPAAPSGLAAVASPGAISLIWDANGEADLGGYLVLRGEAPGEKLQALTPSPIRDTTYRDETVKPGVRYVYAVVAVDSVAPPNVSAQSGRVEEMAR
jgi:predicted small lipoprotein YifL